MASWLVVFASLNQVALLKRALYREGIYVEMLRTPRGLSSTGCSFAVRCQPAEVAPLLETCRRFKVEQGGIFEETGEAASMQYRSLDEDEPAL